MRFLSMVKMNEAKMTTTPKAMIDAMNAMVEEAAKDGCVIGAGTARCRPRAACARLAGGRLTLTDGPFTEAKEVVGGYAIFETPVSKAQMWKWTERFMELHKLHMPGWEGECEVRQIPDPGQEVCG